ncbi:MAG: tetratricopeptide repeat protein [Caldimonas sp.]
MLAPPAVQVELELARIEGSAAFRSSPRHRALLRHLVTRSLANEKNALKESVIAVEVFERPVASFDPRVDSIVRVESRRLRARLAEYRDSEGRDSAIRIELPVGSYVPLITTRPALSRDESVTRRARDLVERGDHFLRQALSRRTLEEALERFELALRESPSYALAFIGAGRAWFNLATGWHHDPAVASEHAAEALRRGLELDPHNAIGHVLIGAVEHQFERDWPAAKASFQRAIAAGPQHAFVHSAYGAHLMMHGSYKAADQELALARQLDPHYVNTRIHMVNLRIAQGRLDDAQAEIEAMRDIATDTLAVVGMHAALALFRGDAHKAIHLYERACEVAPDYSGCFIALAGAHAMAGDVETADALVGATRARFDERLMSPYVMAIFATRCRRPDEAFALLERALRERDPNAVQIGFDSSFEDLRDDARWSALVAGIARSSSAA